MYQVDGGDSTTFKGGGGMGRKEWDASVVGGEVEALER